MNRLSDIDWDRWQAKDPATLVFVFRGDEILLINKKTGLGKGKVNGPGGKVDPGETPEAAAIRECREELHIDVSDLEYCGEHRFQFVDGYSIHVWVYRTQVFEGSPPRQPKRSRSGQRSTASPSTRCGKTIATGCR